ncbi:hypothetical protein E2562_028678 [Oryza meyeriana var. granulata]|uniref:Uncharacterized protein n=1 Tax=Oryza meyeriana var. granulata TaxID=110450 RepID=A0A6G1BP90_9ORYZ|nr:hypothetical protein E2562_028678 [Oryza meyeriana var. granulata]
MGTVTTAPAKSFQPNITTPRSNLSLLCLSLRRSKPPDMPSRPVPSPARLEVAMPEQARGQSSHPAPNIHL